MEKVKVHCLPILAMANICTMIQHNPKVKAVRVNGKISGVKQPQDQSKYLSIHVPGHRQEMRMVQFTFTKYLSIHVPGHVQEMRMVPFTFTKYFIYLCSRAQAGDVKGSVYLH